MKKMTLTQRARLQHRFTNAVLGETGFVILSGVENFRAYVLHRPNRTL